MTESNVIYKIVCLLDGKSYIGKAKNLEKRIKKHKRNVGKIKSPLYSAIQSHGWKNFSIEILCIVKSYKELDRLEAAYIKEHNTLYPAGYNLTAGGTGGDTLSLNPKKEEIVPTLGFKKGISPWNKGLKGVQVAWNKGTKGLMKPNQTTFKPGKEHPMYGKKQSPETVAKRRANIDYSKIQRRTVGVLQCDVEGNVVKEWSSIKEANDAYSLSKGLLRWYLDKERTLKGYMWKRKK